MEAKLGKEMAHIHRILYSIQLMEIKFVKVMELILPIKYFTPLTGTKFVKGMGHTPQIKYFIPLMVAYQSQKSLVFCITFYRISSNFRVSKTFGYTLTRKTLRGDNKHESLF